MDDNQGNPRRSKQGQKVYFVEDLREKLNRKRAEQNQEPTNYAPPPDPRYNFLKDPARDSETDVKENKKQPNQNQNWHKKNPRQFREQWNEPHNKPHKENTNVSYRNNTYRNKNDNFNRNYHKTEQNRQLFNIKVEFSTLTGEHNYSLDRSAPISIETKEKDRTQTKQYKKFDGRGIPDKNIRPNNGDNVRTKFYNNKSKAYSKNDDKNSNKQPSVEHKNPNETTSELLKENQQEGNEKEKDNKTIKQVEEKDDVQEKHNNNNIEQVNKESAVEERKNSKIKEVEQKSTLQETKNDEIKKEVEQKSSEQETNNNAIEQVEQKSRVQEQKSSTNAAVDTLQKVEVSLEESSEIKINNDEQKIVQSSDPLKDEQGRQVGE